MSTNPEVNAVIVADLRDDRVGNNTFLRSVAADRIEELEAALAASEAKVKELREYAVEATKFLDYGGHHYGCASTHGGGAPCDCGYSAFLAREVP